jgi:acyl carrier protein
MNADTSAILAGIAQIIHRLFKFPVHEVDMETTAEDVNGWDSLSHTIFLMEIERHFAVHLDPFSVSKLRCVGDLVEMIRDEAT